jgi:uncharacterized protein YwqG
VNPYVFLVVAVVAAVLIGRRIAARRHGHRAGPPAHPGPNPWRAEFEANNPDSPPFTRQEIEDFRAWRATLALPAVELLPAPDQAVAAAGTRLGGPVWLADGEAWPTDADGHPLEFVAQVDFSELPPLPDFPAAGLLQFFIGSDDVFGADFDEPANGSARVLWWPDGPRDGGLQPPPPRGEGMSPFERDDVSADGLPLAGQPAEHLPDASNWHIRQRLEGHLRRPGIEEIDALLWDETEARPLRHHAGGHPAFTQDDFREPGAYGDFDRTLLRLTSDRTLLWGDCGEAVFLIRRDDLLRRDFSSAIFYWDCS